MQGVQRSGVIRIYSWGHGSVSCTRERRAAGQAGSPLPGGARNPGRLAGEASEAAAASDRPGLQAVGAQMSCEVLQYPDACRLGLGTPVLECLNHLMAVAAGAVPDLLQCGVFLVNDAQRLIVLQQ